ncbi:MAG: SRPBCC family protein [Bacteroidia bacterium]|nr:SRPBCC family protein [Bacteroidia bacterium]MDW8157461.1 SRPBCC family protein [Bacteroidia bacterium]
MKRYQKILLLIVVLISAFILSGFLLPAQYQVKRSIIIQASDTAIFQQINSMRNWKNWIAWNEKKDPTAQYYFRGPEFGVGSQMEWQGREVGQGIITIKSSTPNKSVQYDLLLEQGSFKGFGSLSITAEQKGYRLTWQDQGNLGNNPLFRWAGFLFMDSMLGSAFEEGLHRLKTKLENSPSSAQE